MKSSLVKEIIGLAAEKDFTHDVFCVLSHDGAMEK